MTDRPFSGPPCPLCGEPTDAEHVDIGVGMQRVEPWSCSKCLWTEGAPEVDFDMMIDAEENADG